MTMEYFTRVLYTNLYGYAYQMLRRLRKCLLLHIAAISDFDFYCIVGYSFRFCYSLFL